MVDRSKNRSDRYQSLFAELPYSNEMMAEFAEREGIMTRNDPELRERYLDAKERLNEMMAEFAEREGIMTRNDPELRERYLDAKERLRLAFWRLVDEQLTARQREVMKLYCAGFTQIEIARKLNVNQSSITKSINGNCDYRNGKRIYGGAKKKLRRLADKDPEIQEILKELAEINAEYDYW